MCSKCLVKLFLIFKFVYYIIKNANIIYIIKVTIIFILFIIDFNQIYGIFYILLLEQNYKKEAHIYKRYINNTKFHLIKNPIYYFFIC